MFGPSIFGGVAGGPVDANRPTAAHAVATDDMVPLTVTRPRYSAVDATRPRFIGVDTSRARFDAVTKTQGRFPAVPSGIKTFLPVHQGRQPTAASEAVRSAYMQTVDWNNHHAGIFHSPVRSVPGSLGASPDGLGAVASFSGLGATPGCGGCGGFLKVR